MMLDWVASLLVATLVAVTLTAIGATVVHEEAQQFSVGEGLGTVANTVTGQVNLDAGLGVSTAQNFTFSQSGNGTVLPTNVAGFSYELLVTPNFLFLSAVLPHSTVSRSASFESDVHLWPLSILQTLEQQHDETSLGQVGDWDQAYPCLQFADGSGFQVQVLQVWIDGQPVYLTTLSVTSGYSTGCT